MDPVSVCQVCGKKTSDVYHINPATGRKCPTQTWCASCYEAAYLKSWRDREEKPCDVRLVKCGSIWKIVRSTR
jgi:hypothetical protein